MATENIVTGKYYRILKDKANDIWDRISFWTHADDVQVSSGVTLTSDLNTKNTKITATQTDFATIESSSVAAHTYIKGNLLVFNNQLYRAKTAIAVGNTLTVGTNIEAVNVGTLSNMLTASNGNAFYFDVKNGTYGFYPTASKTSSEFVPFGGTGILPANKGILIGSTSGTIALDISSGSCTITEKSACHPSCVINVSAWTKVKTNNDALYDCKGFNNLDSMTTLSISYSSFTDISAYDYIAFWTSNNTLTFQ